jgi:hypothetical protein
MPEEKPQVELTWDLWCARHLEPYRAKWPQGASVAMMMLFDTAARMEAVAEAADHNTEKLTDALQRFKPLCCFIPHDKLLDIYSQTVPGFNG